MAEKALVITRKLFRRYRGGQFRWVNTESDLRLQGEISNISFENDLISTTLNWCARYDESSGLWFRLEGVTGYLSHLEFFETREMDKRYRRLEMSSTVQKEDVAFITGDDDPEALEKIGVVGFQDDDEAIEKFKNYLWQIPYCCLGQYLSVSCRLTGDALVA